ncbi:MAG TPA: hypothetical protein VN033_00410 [Vulgatibacter sp.]|nr:hypothetical protein [Vulgatibacter sp.]
MRRHAWAAVGILLATACASHTTIPDEDRVRLERSLPGRTFYLRHSMYLGPFWSDPGKRFLSDVVPGEIPWVVNPAGEPMDPGAPTAVIPAGTRVRIVKLELPTGRAVTLRNPFLPRYNPWLFLEVAGLPRDPVPVMILRADLGSHAEVLAEIDRFLSRDDLSPLLGALEPEIRKAVAEKRLVAGMSPSEVAMAWGWPERRKLSSSPDGKREEWIWPSARRHAVIVGDRLLSWEGEGTQVGVGSP